MIVTTDLRIGNWVTVSEVICQVTRVAETKVNLRGYKSAYKQEELNPIPITQEIIERAGFKKRERTDLFDKIPIEGFTYHLYAHKIMLFHTGENMLCHWLNTKIVFLHQMQNFYYYVTGKEIQISF